MAEINAAAVKAFREKTGLPLMDCKQALTEANGDQDKAIELLRQKGQKLGATRTDRETAFGRFGIGRRDGTPRGRALGARARRA